MKFSIGEPVEWESEKRYFVGKVVKVIDDFVSVEWEQIDGKRVKMPSASNFTRCPDGVWRHQDQRFHPTLNEPLVKL
jgi:hypothetical protein